MDAGIGGGYLQLAGKNKSILSSYMIPVLASVRYRIPLDSQISINPAVKCGMSYNMARYSFADSTRTRQGIEPLVCAGADAHYRLDPVSVSAGAECIVIIERQAVYGALNLKVGAAYDF